MKRLALIDGDIIVHRCTVVFDDDPVDLGGGVFKFDFDAAYRNVKQQVRRIVSDVGAQAAIFCLTGKGNFRKSMVDEAYKGNRTGRKPILFPVVKEAVMKKCGSYPSQFKHGLEADDLMGILATSGDTIPAVAEYDERVICTIDKDLLTIPGLHWNFDKQDLDDAPVVVDEAEAAMRFYRQAAAGDMTDGYKGCPGVGPKGAEKLIPEGMDDERDMWESVVEAYEAQGLTVDDAIRNARCARILRSEDYNFKTKQIRLWEPPGGSTSETE